jgi:hypothetical protein
VTAPRYGGRFDMPSGGFNIIMGVTKQQELAELNGAIGPEGPEDGLLLPG